MVMNTTIPATLTSEARELRVQLQREDVGKENANEDKIYEYPCHY